MTTELNGGGVRETFPLFIVNSSSFEAIFKWEWKCMCFCMTNKLCRQSAVDMCTRTNISLNSFVPTIHQYIDTGSSTHLCMFTYAATMANCLVLNKFSKRTRRFSDMHGHCTSTCYNYDCPEYFGVCACVAVAVSAQSVTTLFQVKRNENCLHDCNTNTSKIARSEPFECIHS